MEDERRLSDYNIMEESNLDDEASDNTEKAKARVQEKEEITQDLKRPIFSRKQLADEKTFSTTTPKNNPSLKLKHSTPLKR